MEKKIKAPVPVKKRMAQPSSMAKKPVTKAPAKKKKTGPTVEEAELFVLGQFGAQANPAKVIERLDELNLLAQPEELPEPEPETLCFEMLRPDY